MIGAPGVGKTKLVLETCKLFNEKFGLTGDKAIDVRVRSDLFNLIKQNESVINDYTQIDESGDIDE